MPEYETHEYDVLVIGAGGAGLRAAVEASSMGARTAVITKSLLGKAHTVMAEGGMAAAMGNVWPQDNWQVHFRDTMRGGKMLNNWRMAQIHAQEAPDRVYELEEWGALFDRTPDGRILQRDFGGHRYARLAHVGDRTGLEMIRILQQRGVHQGLDVFAECTINRLFKDSTGRIAGAIGYRRETGELLLFKAKAVVLATGGAGRIWEITSNSWEGTADGHALALYAGADMIDMECIQFHPTGMVWPLSVKGLLVTEGVRGDGGTLKNIDGKRFMFDYIPAMFAAETADNESEADRWYNDKTVRRTPDLLPRDEVARAINSEVKAGRGTEHGGVFLDIASRRSPEYIRSRLPSMYHQFMQLAGVDITKEAFEVGPTMHYIMGGVRVEAEKQGTAVPGLYAAGEVSGGMHGGNRLGGNSLSDLVVFGRRAGMGAAEYALGLTSAPALDQADVDERAALMMKPLEGDGRENPYAIHTALRTLMQNKVGIIRTESELQEALVEIASLKERLTRVKAGGDTKYNPGWHLALDLEHMITVAEVVTRAAIERKESRGGHTRDDYPNPSPEFGKVNIVDRLGPNGVEVRQEPLPQMPPELAELFADGGDDAHG